MRNRCCKQYWHNVSWTSAIYLSYIWVQSDLLQRQRPTYLDILCGGVLRGLSRLRYLKLHVMGWVPMISKTTVYIIKRLIQAAPNPNIWMFLVSSCSSLCPIYWSQVLSPEWRCSWSSADRRCSKYIWASNNHTPIHLDPNARHAKATKSGRFYSVISLVWSYIVNENTNTGYNQPPRACLGFV